MRQCELVMIFFCKSAQNIKWSTTVSGYPWSKENKNGLDVKIRDEHLSNIPLHRGGMAWKRFYIAKWTVYQSCKVQTE